VCPGDPSAAVAVADALGVVAGEAPGVVATDALGVVVGDAGGDVGTAELPSAATPPPPALAVVECRMCLLVDSALGGMCVGCCQR